MIFAEDPYRLMFGSIASVGMNTLIKARVDLHAQRNLVIVAVTLIFGIGGIDHERGAPVGSAEHTALRVALALRTVAVKVLKENPKISNPYPNVDAVSGTLLNAAG